MKRQRLPSEAAQNELAMFKLLNDCPHKHVMKLLDYYVSKADGKTFYLCMVFPFMDQTLERVWVNRCGLLQVDVARRFLHHAVMGVAHLHSRGIVHGDLSLSNFHVGSETGFKPNQEGSDGFPASVVKVSDLGGAACASSCALEPDERMGTLYVRAPELILGCKKPSKGVDLWSLGVVGAALLAGTSLFWPFRHETERKEALQRHLSGVAQTEKAITTATEAHVLKQQVKFLGPMPPNLWQDYASTSLLPSHSEALEQKASHDSPAAYLQDQDLVKRALQREGDASRFLLLLLRWGPTERPTAEDAMQHGLFAQNGDVALEAESLAQTADQEVLARIVSHSIRTETAVTAKTLSDAVLASRQAAALPQRKRRLSPDSASQRAPALALDGDAARPEDTLRGNVEGRDRVQHVGWKKRGGWSQW